MRILSLVCCPFYHAVHPSSQAHLYHLESILLEALSRRVPGHLPGNYKVPGSMPRCGILQLLFPWVRNFTPITPANQLLNREKYCTSIFQGTAEELFLYKQRENHQYHDEIHNVQ